MCIKYTPRHTQIVYRLKKNLDRCTSSTQKAYSSTKLIQEAVFNIINVIAKSKDENKALALLTIDFAKVFDTAQYYHNHFHYMSLV